VNALCTANCEPSTGLNTAQHTKELLKKVRLIELKTRGLSEHIFSGEYHSAFKGRGMTFSEVREYAPGDEVRTIDWNVTARFGHPFVKVFEEERELTVVLMADVSGSGDFGTENQLKRELITEACATIAFSAIKNNDRVGLIIGTDVIETLVPPKKGDKHVVRVIREILGFSPQYPGTDLKLALDTLSRVAKRRSVAFVLSDFFADGYERALALAAAKHDIIPVMIVDPRDETLPDVGLASFEDWETGEEIVVDTSDRRVRDHYGKTMKKLRQERLKMFQKLALDTVVVRTDKSFVEPLRELFARRARRLRR